MHRTIARCPLMMREHTDAAVRLLPIYRNTPMPGWMGTQGNALSPNNSATTCSCAPRSLSSLQASAGKETTSQNYWMCCAHNQE